MLLSSIFMFFVLYLGYIIALKLFIVIAEVFKGKSSNDDELENQRIKQKQEIELRKIQLDKEEKIEESEWLEKKKSLMHNNENLWLNDKDLRWSKLKESQEVLAELAKIKEINIRNEIKVSIKKRQELKKELIESKVEELNSIWTEHKIGKLYNFGNGNIKVGEKLEFYDLRTNDYKNKISPDFGFSSDLSLSYFYNMDGPTPYLIRIPAVDLFSMKIKINKGIQFESFLECSPYGTNDFIDVILPWSFQVVNKETRMDSEGNKIYPQYAYQAFQDRLKNESDSNYIFSDQDFMLSLPGKPLADRFKDIDPLVSFTIGNLYFNPDFRIKIHRYMIKDEDPK